ncbi:elongation factor P [Patescibacteria group bacterium]
MLSYNEIKPKKIIILDDEPWEVLTSQITKKSRQKASNQAKLKSMKTGKVVEKAFHQADSVKEADIIKKPIKYLYTNKGEFWFCEENDPSARFILEESIIGDNSKFMKENTLVDALIFDTGDEEEIIGIKLPIKVDLEVVEAPPNIKGNTSSGGDKKVILETGAEVTTPLFIEAGEMIRVNTETGEYAERVN